MTQPAGRASPIRNAFGDSTKSVPWSKAKDFPTPPPFLNNDASGKRQGNSSPTPASQHRFNLPQDSTRHIPIKVINTPHNHHHPVGAPSLLGTQQQQQQPAFPYRSNPITPSNAPNALPPRTAASNLSARAGAAPPIPPAAPQSVAKSYPTHLPVQVSKPPTPADLYGKTNAPNPTACQFPQNKAACTANPPASHSRPIAVPNAPTQHRVPPQQIAHSPPTGDHLPSCKVFNQQYSPYDPTKINEINKSSSAPSQPRPFADIASGLDSTSASDKALHEDCPLLSIDSSSPIEKVGPAANSPQCVINEKDDTLKAKEQATGSPVESDASGTWQRIDDPVKDSPLPSSLAKARFPPNSPPSIANRSHIPALTDDAIKLPEKKTEVMTDKQSDVIPLVGEPFSKGNLNPPVANPSPPSPTPQHDQRDQTKAQ